MQQSLAFVPHQAKSVHVGSAQTAYHVTYRVKVLRRKILFHHRAFSPVHQIC